MALSFAQLLKPRTWDQSQNILLNALQGLGVISSQNSTGGVAAGTGSLQLSGSPVANYSLAVKIVTSGELGTGVFQYATDGVTYSGNITIPVSGNYAITAIGVTAIFVSGPSGSGTSFVNGDVYSAPLTYPNFPVSSWQPGAVPRTLVYADAQALADHTALIPQIAGGGILATNPATGQPYAQGPWLDLLGVNVYNLTRVSAVATIGLATLTDAQGAGPFTISTGQLILQAANGQQYTNSTSGTLPKNGTLQLTFQALIPGSAGNVGNSTITTLATALPGVTVNNPGVGVNNTWITTSGSDAETDLAYAARCMLRWPSLGIGATAATYTFWAQSAATGVSSAITRTYVQTDAVQGGKVDVYIANATGAPSGGDVTLVQNYINPLAPLTVTVAVAAASNVSLNVTVTVYFKNAVTTSSAVQAAASTALNNYIQNLPIGSDNTPTVKAFVSQLVSLFQNIFGVRNVVLSAPAVDFGVNLGQVVVLGSYTPTFTGV